MDLDVLDELLGAIARGEPVTIEEILKLNLDLNAFGATNQRTPLMAAAYANRSDLIRSLAHNGAVIDLQGGYFRMAAIHEAAAEGRVEAIEALLDLGSNIELIADHGTTPLMLAAAWGNCDALRYLISKGVQLNRVDERGWNAWMMAKEKEEHEAAALLEAAGSDTWAPGFVRNEGRA